MRSRWGVTFVCVVLGILCTAAGADTTASVRAQIRALELSPAMLFPTRLPSRPNNANASLDTSSYLTVLWDRGSLSNGYKIGYTSLARADRSELERDFATARRDGYKPRRVKVGKRYVWRLCGHICGYAWLEQGRTYEVLGIYYIGDEYGQTVAAAQRQIIRSLAPLR
jgi:hypothetical protein